MDVQGIRTRHLRQLVPGAAACDIFQGTAYANLPFPFTLIPDHSGGRLRFSPVDLNPALVRGWRLAFELVNFDHIIGNDQIFALNGCRGAFDNQVAVDRKQAFHRQTAADIRAVVDRKCSLYLGAVRNFNIALSGCLDCSVALAVTK
ncbi:hypothetical protein D3C76_213420 [compost metagenome]